VCRLFALLVFSWLVATCGNTCELEGLSSVPCGPFGPVLTLDWTGSHASHQSSGKTLSGMAVWTACSRPCSPWSAVDGSHPGSIAVNSCLVSRSSISIFNQRFGQCFRHFMKLLQVGIPIFLNPIFLNLILYKSQLYPRFQRVRTS
jgi:hypothetical protein